MTVKEAQGPRPSAARLERFIAHILRLELERTHFLEWLLAYTEARLKKDPSWKIVDRPILPKPGDSIEALASESYEQSGLSKEAIRNQLWAVKAKKIVSPNVEVSMGDIVNRRVWLRQASYRRPNLRQGCHLPIKQLRFTVRHFCTRFKHLEDYGYESFPVGDRKRVVPAVWDDTGEPCYVMYRYALEAWASEGAPVKARYPTDGSIWVIEATPEAISAFIASERSTQNPVLPDYSAPEDRETSPFQISGTYGAILDQGGTPAHFETDPANPAKSELLGNRPIIVIPSSYSIHDPYTDALAKRMVLVHELEHVFQYEYGTASHRVISSGQRSQQSDEAETENQANEAMLQYANDFGRVPREDAWNALSAITSERQYQACIAREYGNKQTHYRMIDTASPFYGDACPDGYPYETIKTFSKPIPDNMGREMLDHYWFRLNASYGHPEKVPDEYVLDVHKYSLDSVMRILRTLGATERNVPAIRLPNGRSYMPDMTYRIMVDSLPIEFGLVPVYGSESEAQSWGIVLDAGAIKSGSMEDYWKIAHSLANDVIAGEQVKPMSGEPEPGVPAPGGLAAAVRDMMSPDESTK